MSIKNKLIMLPGPTNVSERVMKSMLKPIINHRGEEFSSLLRSIVDKSKHLFQTSEEVIVLSSSGTGGVEAAVWNVIRQGDKAIVPVFGEFSERLAESIELAGGTAIRVRADYGNAPTLKDIEIAMQEQGEFKALYLVHNETSTGVAVPEIEQICRKANDHGAFVIVDAISSLGGYSIPVDELGIDICVTGSQKCIAAPPGASLLSVSKRMVEYLRKNKPRTRYFDILRYIDYLKRGETPFTPSLPIFYALDEALSELVEEGLMNRVNRHERHSAALYNAIQRMGLRPFANPICRSRTVVASLYPNWVNDNSFRKILNDEFGVVIAGGFGPLKGKVFRIGCMGNISEEYVVRTAIAIEEALKRLADSPEE